MGGADKTHTHTHPLIACSITHPNFYIVSIYIYSNNNHHHRHRHHHHHHHHHHHLHLLYISIYLPIYLSKYTAPTSPGAFRLAGRADGPHRRPSAASLHHTRGLDLRHLAGGTPERLAPRIQGWKIHGKTPGFGCFGMKHVPMFFDSDAGVIWVFDV